MFLTSFLWLNHWFAAWIMVAIASWVSETVRFQFTVQLALPHLKNLIGCLCPACGYNLTGNTSGICPECGKTILWNA